MQLKSGQIEVLVGIHKMPSKCHLKAYNVHTMCLLVIPMASLKASYTNERPLYRMLVTKCPFLLPKCSILVTKCLLKAPQTECV